MTLFDHMMNGIFPPATRRTDPAMSRTAEHRINRNGQRASHCARVLSCVRKYPGMTAVELLPWCGLERHEISRRLADLRSRGDVVVSGSRKCRVRGTRMQVWEAT